MKKIYLAGPEIFLIKKDIDINEEKRKICRKYNLKPIIPTDGLKTDKGKSEELAKSIFNHCIKNIDESDLLLANITPFRGTSADAGTAFEIGYALGTNKKIVSYTNNNKSILRRIQTIDNINIYNDLKLDSNNYFIEDFNKQDNLMLTESSTLLVYDNNDIFNLETFEKTIYFISKKML